MLHGASDTWYSVGTLFREQCGTSAKRSLAYLVHDAHPHLQPCQRCHLQIQSLSTKNDNVKAPDRSARGDSAQTGVSRYLTYAATNNEY